MPILTFVCFFFLHRKWIAQMKAYRAMFPLQWNVFIIPWHHAILRIYAYFFFLIWQIYAFLSLLKTDPSWAKPTLFVGQRLKNDRWSEEMRGLSARLIQNIHLFYRLFVVSPQEATKASFTHCTFDANSRAKNERFSYLVREGDETLHQSPALTFCLFPFSLFLSQNYLSVKVLEALDA